MPTPRTAREPRGERGSRTCLATKRLNSDIERCRDTQAHRMFRIRTVKQQPENRRNVRALRHARCEGHRHYYDVLPASACSGKERVASGTVPLSVGSKYRNLRIAQESLAASLTWCVRGRFDAEARSPPTHTTDSQLTRCYVSRPSNIKPTMPPTCTKTSRQHNRSNEAKPTPPTVKRKAPDLPCMPTYWHAS